MSDVVSIERQGHVGTVTITREERRNALSQGVVEGLIAALNELGAEPELRAIVITGAGEKAFCAGGDLSDQQASGGPLGMHEGRGSFVELLLTMSRCPKPLIARVNGHALGGGFGLVLSCDMAVAAPNATFGTPELKVGLFPMMITAVIQRNLHRKHALELMLTGQRISAGRALEIGVVNHVAEEGQLDEKLGELLTRVTAFSPAIVKLGRQAFYDTQDMGFEQALRTLQAQLTINTLAEDAAEGIMAFISKREPDWKGR